MSYMNNAQIKKMGFASIGRGVLLSCKASYYNCGRILIGDNVRIDDFCVLSAGKGGIQLGDNIHIGVYCLLSGRGKIRMGDFSTLSSRVSVYSSSDDYTGSMMTNPTIPPEFTDVTHADVTIGKHVIIGSGSVVLPGVTIEEGVAIGSLSLVKNNCRAFSIYCGLPAKRLRERKKDLLVIERRFVEKFRKDALPNLSRKRKS